MSPSSKISFTENPSLSISSCECTESRPSSIKASSRRRRSRPHNSSFSRFNSQRLHPNLHRQTSAAMSTVTSSQSDSPTDDDDDEADRSTLNNDDTQYLSSPDRLTKLPPPDLVASIKSTTNFNDEYCQQLQQMAQFSKEQSSQTEIPFFGKDDHVINTQCNELPTSTLEKNVLFN